MKSRIINIFITILLFVCFTSMVHTKAYANAPILNGSVTVKGTNAPVVGVWVKWVDDTGNIRYAQTDTSGKFSFASWQNMTQAQRTTQASTKIDTNLDGTPDAMMASTSNSIYFGCLQSPHNFTAVVPKGQNYTFSTVVFSFANIGVQISPPPIIENPPSPTPTPVPACGISCSTPADCASAKDGCTSCVGGVCKTPVCGDSCSTNKDCSNTKDGCTTCANNKCAAPTPTPSPVPACGVACSTPADCANAKDGCTTCANNKCAAPTPTPTPIPACGVSCSTPADCASAKDGCTSCIGGVCKTPACGTACASNKDCINSKDGCTLCTAGQCTAPTPTPTPTPVPACGVACSKPADCLSAKDGCTACIGGVCKAPACGASCTTNKDCANTKDGCTSCISGVCTAPACGSSCSTPADCANAKDSCTTCTNNQCTAPTPTPTPTPVPACGVACSKPTDCASAKNGCTSCTGGVCTVPFNPAACTCDGVDNTELFTGSNAVITAYAKVTGADTSSAQVVDQSFFLAEGDETTGTIIAKSGPVPATVLSSSSTLVRYSSQWQLTLPNLTPGATYRLWSQINCQPRTLAMNMSVRPKHVVLAAQSQPSLLTSILNFFTGLFTNVTGTTSTVTPTITPPTPSPTSSSTKTLQLKTLYPAQVVQKTCTFIKFKVQGL